MAIKLSLLILLSLLAFESRAESSSSVVFFDAPNQKFIRSNPLEIEGEVKKFSASEIAATISVLLGFAPPASLTADSSFKLNEVLFPNPFERPRAVFVLEVAGVRDPSLSFAYSSNQVGSTFSSNVLGSSSKADIELSDEDEVSVLPLDEPLGVECDAACVGKELAKLAQWLGGTSVGNLDSLDGELKFSLPSGSSLNLYIAKKPDRLFALSLVSFLRSIRKALDIHEDFAGSSMPRAELLIGRFTGIEALKEEYGSGDVVHQGVELLQTALIKSFELLQKSHGGKIVGVVLLNSEPSANSEAILDVKFSGREFRWLQEVRTPSATIIAELTLVRRSLAWITGIILLVSTLIGVYFLLNMPLTRDTLLYSNVKLD